jgi:hypothetical protein
VKLQLKKTMRISAILSLVLTLLAAFDMQFVILQRYNRPRVLKFINK